MFIILKNKIKNILFRVQNLINSFWLPSCKIHLESLLYSEIGNNIFLIQIGANDGVSSDKLNDFILKSNCNALLIEPVPHLFELLKYNYRNLPRVKCVNSAIGAVNEKLIFYSINPDLDNSNNSNLIFKENELRQLGSFKKEVLLKHSFMHPKFSSLIEEILVPVITLEKLFLSNSIFKVDLLLIDVEGYEYEILTAFKKYNIYKFKYIVFEHLHLRNFKYLFMIIFLKFHGYKIYVDGWDTVCIKKI